MPGHVQFAKDAHLPAEWRTPTGGLNDLFASCTIDLRAYLPWVRFTAPDGQTWCVRGDLIEWVYSSRPPSAL